jgi:hypothetical protein
MESIVSAPAPVAAEAVSQADRDASDEASRLMAQIAERQVELFRVEAALAAIRAQ